METNEANTDILPEGLKTVINNFKQPTEENGVEFNGEAKKLNASLSQLRESIKITPAAIRDSRITEFITIASLRIRELEDSRSEYANKFKDGVSSLIEELKNKIKNDDKQRICLIKLTEVVDKMSTDNGTLGSATNKLIAKLTRLNQAIQQMQSDGWGEETYKKQITQMINEIVDSDLPSVYRRRQSILEAIEAIKAAEG